MSRTDGSQQAEMFSLQIRRSIANAPFQVQIAEVVRPGFRHRLTFARENTLSEVLQPQLALFIQSLLDGTIDTGPKILTQPDVTMVLPGLILGRLKAIVGGAIGTERQATLRFRYFIGGIQNAFAARTHFDRPALDHREEIGMRALEDVTVPLLNMAMTAKSWHGSAGASQAAARMLSALTSIEGHAVELEFYAGLLRRYVQECGPGRAEALQRFEDPVQRMMQMAEPPVPALRKRGEP